MATFNFEDALKQLQSGKPLTGLESLFLKWLYLFKI